MLHPHAKRFLDMTAAAGAPDMASLTPAGMRRSFEALAQMMDLKDVPVGHIENSTLPGPGGPLAIRIYTPFGGADDGRRPGLIYFHGGGCVFGSLDTHDGLCRMLANASACRLISVDYRLAPEHKFPAAVDDSDAAVRFIAEHAPTFGLDPARLCVGGDSAGGGLAAFACQSARRRTFPRLALQLLLCPVLDLHGDTDSRRELANGYFLNEATIDWMLAQYLPPHADLNDPRVSPLRTAEFAGLPPAHIHTAAFDPLRDEGKAYANRLQQAGVAVAYTCHPGMIHHFYGLGGIIPYARTAIAAAGAAVRDALGDSQGSVRGARDAAPAMVNGG
jgi:acetyl esterase